jgi:hypothetical protein
MPEAVILRLLAELRPPQIEERREAVSCHVFQLKPREYHAL